MDPMRGRFPIKLTRTDSPTSTLSSRRPYSRQDHRGNNEINFSAMKNSFFFLNK